MENTFLGEDKKKKTVPGSKQNTGLSVEGRYQTANCRVTACHDLKPKYVFTADQNSLKHFYGFIVSLVMHTSLKIDHTQISKRMQTWALTAA